MAHSREVRLPFLFHELVEFVFSLPPYFKINDGWTKWIMRVAFKDLLPGQIALRIDKIGYEPPQKKWMENKIVKERVQESKRKLFDHKVISKKEYENDIVSEKSSDGRNKSWDLWMGGKLF
jgi:asparagine synthase (glutamine-hydrolysing)